MNEELKLSVITDIKNGQPGVIQAYIVTLREAFHCMGEPWYVEYSKVIMFEACRLGNVDLVEFLVNESPLADILINCTNENGETPLHIASMMLNVQVCRVIIKRGACSVNSQSITGQTPLHLAIGAENGELAAKSEVTRLLLTVPACDPHIADIQGVTPLQVAHKMNNEIFLALLEKGCVEGYASTEQMVQQAMKLTDNKLLHLIVDSNTGSRITQWICRNLKSFPVMFVKSEAAILLSAAVRAEDTESVELLLNSWYPDPNVKPGRNGDTPLITACKMGLLQIAHNLLEYYRDLDFNVQNSEGNTALHCALSRRFSGIEVKLAKCTKPNLVNKRGETPLHIACATLNLPVVSEIVMKAHRDVNVQTHTGQTPLHLAIAAEDGEQESKIEIIQLLLKVFDCYPSIRNSDGDTPLTTACKRVHHQPLIYCQIINALLQHVVAAGGSYQEAVETLQSCNQLDLTNEQGEAPLHIACKNLWLEAVKILLIANCNVNLQLISSGQTPLHLAVEPEGGEIESKVEIVKLLLAVPDCDPNLRNSVGDTPLISACKTVGMVHDYLTIVNAFLLSEKCNPNIINYHGYTALHCAATGGCRDAIQALVFSQACDPNSKGKTGVTPLHIACFRVQAKGVQALLEFGKCKVNLQTNTGETPLHMVVMTKFTINVDSKLEIIHLLLKYPDCNPNIRNHNGDTPLTSACKDITTHVFNFLIIRAFISSDRCDPNSQDNNGNTALHIAIMENSQEAVEDLLQCASTKPDIQNKFGETPLHIACSKLNILTVTVLLKDGRCDVNAQTNTGQTPLHLVLTAQTTSRENSKERVARLLLAVPHCDPLTLDAQGITPLQIAQRTDISLSILILDKACTEGFSDTKDVVEQEIMALTDNNHLHLVTRLGATGVMRCLLKLQGSPVTVNEVEASSGDTPLIAAIKVECVAAVELLLDSQYCDPTARTTSGGDTPLIVACKMAVTHQTEVCVQMFHLLLSNDQCDPNSQNDKGDTALHIAAAGRCQKVVDALVGHERYKPDIVNSQGETPLHVACHELNLSTVSAFWKCDINKNLQTNSGQTPLHLVVGAQEVKPGSKLELIHLLLSHPDCTDTNTHPIVHNQECDPNMRNSSGDTPLHIAVEDSTSEILAALLQYKRSDPNVQNNSGETPLHIACKLRNYDCMIALTTNKECNVNIADDKGHTALHKAIYNMHPSDLSLIEYLISNSPCDVTACDLQGNTALHIACTKGAWKQDESIVSVIRLLLSTGNVDPQCVNNAGETPIQLAISNNQIVQELSSFSTAQLDHPVQTFVKMFVVGNAETGKSTLVESVRTDAPKSRRFAPSQFKTVKGVKPHTAGIIPIPVSNRHFGNAVIYDFAGQHEYYSSHAAVLENLVLSSPPVFLLTIDLSESFDYICETVAYWWSFIGSYSSRSSSSPHVIIVGSHKDVVKSRGEKVQEILNRLLAVVKEIPTNFTLVDCVTLDCRMVASEGLTKLLSMLKHTCETVRRDVKIDLRCHILSSFLSDTHSDRIACTLAEIVDSVKAEENTLLPQSTADLVNLLAALSDKDRILLLKNPGHLEDSWIILQRQKLFGDINGSIFAPEYFDEYVPDFVGNTGIVPVSKLKKHFPQYPDPEVITGFLSHLQFCFKIGDFQTLELITTDESGSAPDEEFYFFPALVNRNKPPEKDVWNTSTTKRQLRRRYGWFYECAHRYQYMMPRFLHVLILRLAFSYALAMEHKTSHDFTVVRRRCSVWKRGIAWRNNDGIEAIVEVGQRNHWVVVMMQCPAGMEAECTQLKTSVIKTVLDAKEEFCPEVAMNEYLMHPGITHYPFQRTNQLALYSLTEVCKVIIEGKTYVVDKGGLHQSALVKLLPCEPYIGLGKRLMSHLFISEHAQQVMTDRVFSEVAQGMMRSNPDASQQKLKLLAKELLPSIEPFFPPDDISECVLECTHLLQQVTPITFQNLNKLMSKFSILCSRNPWDLSGLSPTTELLECRFIDSGSEHHLRKTDDSLLGIESLLEVRMEVVSAVGHTASLGLTLGLSQSSKLQVIQRNWPDDVAFQLTEIMAAWLQGMGNSSWRSLAKALLDPAVGCPVIAQAVMEHHPTHTHCSDTSEDDTLFQEVDEASLDETSPGDILSTVVQGGHYSWFHLGLVLGLHYGTLKIIQNEHASYTECVAVVITKWLNQVDSVRRRGQPSWRVLARALAHPLVGQHRLADGIARDHPAQEDASTSVDMSLSESADTSAGSPQSLGPLPPSLSTTHPPPSPSTSFSPSH